MGDFIQNLNNESEQNVDRLQHNLNQYTLYGDFEYVPIQKDRQEKIQNAFNHIDEVCRPTMSKLRQQDNIAELQDTIYRRFLRYQGELNTCIMKARNVRDSNACSDKFVDTILGEGKNFVINTLKRY